MSQHRLFPGLIFRRRARFLRALPVYMLLATSCGKPRSSSVIHDRWEVTGGSLENIRYSSLDQVDTGNVSQLQPVWFYRTGDADTVNHSQIQCNPVILDGIMYATTPRLALVAVDVSTGKEIWRFDPRAIEGSIMEFVLNNNRGVAVWKKGDSSVVFYTAGSYLHAVQAKDGKPYLPFGDQGKVDMRTGLGEQARDRFVTATSPGVIVHDLLIMGSRVSEGTDAAPGHIRAFDCRTGELRWIFHTIPQPGQFGYDTYENPQAYRFIGGANNWSGMSVDVERGLVFAPTGSAAFDFYGGSRKGNNLFGNTLLALDARTGRRKWHYQIIRHDLWDWDLPSPPSLATITVKGTRKDVVVQPTKHGFLFVLDRETGEPVFEVYEKSVSTDTDVEGEQPAPSQPVPTLPLPFVRQAFGEADINPHLPDTSRQRVAERLKSYRNEGIFTPPSRKGTVIFPGFDGGAEWGGLAVDPENNWVYVNANEMAWVLTVVDLKEKESSRENLGQAGNRLYRQHCMSCHGAELQGSGNYPSLLALQTRYDTTSLHGLIRSGRRMMPGFFHLKTEEIQAISAFLLNDAGRKRQPFFVSLSPEDSLRRIPYSITGYNKFLSAEGLPAVAPPWGTLNAIDLQTGQRVWQVPLGDEPQLAARGIRGTGAENYGGPVVTKGGLVFIAAAKDGKLRAFHKRSGKLLWEYALPVPGFATPAVFEWNGRQYLVIACGGGKLGTPSGDYYIAFTLPEAKR